MEFASLPMTSAMVGDEKTTKPGIVYISRVPPRMTPMRLRQLLEGYGALGRLFLAPKEMKNAKAVKGTRKAKQQHGEQGFTEGWVEFMDKKVAKSVSETLNCSKIGHRKGKAFYDDLWNIKYLPKFKWHHLTDQLAYEKAVREQRLRTEISQARKSTEFYLRQADKAKQIQAMEARKQLKAAKTETVSTSVPKTETAEAEKSKTRRTFRQRKPIDKDVPLS